MKSKRNIPKVFVGDGGGVRLREIFCFSCVRKNVSSRTSAMTVPCLWVPGYFQSIQAAWSV